MTAFLGLVGVIGGAQVVVDRDRGDPASVMAEVVRAWNAPSAG